MLHRIVAPLFTVAVVTAAALAAPSPAGASLHHAPEPAFCDAAAEFFDLSFQVQFVKAFAGLSDDPSVQEKVGDVFALVLSPKLENLTSTMADTGPRRVRSLFADQAEVFGRGIEVLVDLGVTRQQVQTLARAPVDLTNSDLEALLGDVSVSEAELEAAAAEFDGDAALEDIGAPPAKRAAFERAIGACGIVPSTGLDCDELVTPDEAADVLGSEAQAESSNGSCVYVASGSDTGDEAELTVEAYQGSRAYQRLTQGTQNQSVPDLGERATAIEGYATFGSTKTCGRTLVVDDGARTVVVALCLPAASDEAPIDTLTDVARSALGRIDD